MIALPAASPQSSVERVALPARSKWWKNSSGKTGEQKYFKFEHEGMDVRFYGATAVVTATANVASSTKGVVIPQNHLRFIHVWYYSKGAWQLVAHQSLKIQ